MPSLIRCPDGRAIFCRMGRTSVLIVQEDKVFLDVRAINPRTELALAQMVGRSTVYTPCLGGLHVQIKVFDFG